MSKYLYVINKRFDECWGSGIKITKLFNANLIHLKLLKIIYY